MGFGFSRSRCHVFRDKLLPSSPGALFSDFFTNEGEPLRCPRCGSPDVCVSEVTILGDDLREDALRGPTDIRRINSSRVDGVECYCGRCKDVLGVKTPDDGWDQLIPDYIRANWRSLT